MKNLLLLLATLPVFAWACPKPWVCETLALDIPYNSQLTQETLVARERIRAGYLPEQGAFKGNILHFEGLADSMLNHSFLFNKLSAAGYRVISFDYMGQGGSTGSMNETRIRYIPHIGRLIWNHFARKEKSPVTILGWSTGGLAAYLAPREFKVDNLILIAPGIHPNVVIGEGFSKLPLNKITFETLTSAHYAPGTDPHVDGIKPSTPLKAPAFVEDLMLSALSAHSFRMPPNVRGLVLLSGTKDSYVNEEKNRQTLIKNAPHFILKTYPGALHEIDNEKANIRNRAHRDILDFLSYK